jgi:hypothetical protein
MVDQESSSGEGKSGTRRPAFGQAATDGLAQDIPEASRLVIEKIVAFGRKGT